MKLDSYQMLAIVTLLPSLMAALMYLLEKKTFFGKAPYWVRQLFFGFVFGLVAVVGTEWGVPMNGAQMNCRDAAVLTGGLMFGAPAGIIAGIIGGVERYVAVSWGIGSFTQIACSVSTIIAGFYAAALRKFMFEDKKPGWFISLAIGIVMEVFHLTTVFITNMSTPEQAIAVVKACTIPMISANGLSVMIAAMVMSAISHENIRLRQSRVRISQTIQRWLLVAIVLAFGATSYFVYSLQNTMAAQQTDSVLTLALSEVDDDMNDAAAKGKTALRNEMPSIAKNRHVGSTGYILVLDKEQKLISLGGAVDADKIREDLPQLVLPEENTTFEATLAGVPVYGRHLTNGDYTVAAILPSDEAMATRNIALYVNCFMEILLFAILYALIFQLIKRLVVNQIRDINTSLGKITDGDLDEIVNVRSNEEFARLSDDINLTVGTLKKYIAEASARIDEELEFAQNIQKSALPNTFPAYPNRRDFDIYASMNPAKEVGGDFYDFYLTDSTLNFLIADVSGKGIPAAMFMMRAKTELKSLTEAKMPLNEVFTTGNAALCEGNDAGMFVTAWQGGVDLNNGTLRYVNAGHNPPLIYRAATDKFEFLHSKVGFVLAGMDGFPYKVQELQLSRGDIVVLYTDGVTEATNAYKELYGEDRLLEAINSRSYESMEELCKFIKSRVDEFVGDAPQFDDITMVAFRFFGTSSITFEHAANSDIPAVTEFVEAELEKVDCPMKAVMQFGVAIDEIYSNIVNHGYGDKPGPITVKVIISQNPRTVYVRFSDFGIPYNPLTYETPDITLSAEERQIGGLGIYLVRQTMDDMRYKYENGQNVLTLVKRL